MAVRVVRDGVTRAAAVVAALAMLAGLLAFAPAPAGAEQANTAAGAGRGVAGTISTGYGHTCAILDGGDVACWGLNEEEHLGLGHDDDRGDEPGEMGDDLETVPLGTDRVAVQVSAGFYHSCAVFDDGSAKCWGANGDGELGLGDTDTRGGDLADMGDALPEVALGAGRSVVSIAAGHHHTCALLDDGSVKCWGDNGDGELGQGHPDSLGDGDDEMGDDLPPVDLGTGRTATAIAVGEDHSCALLDDGSVKCWGERPGSARSRSRGQRRRRARGDGRRSSAGRPRRRPPGRDHLLGITPHVRAAR